MVTRCVRRLLGVIAVLAVLAVAGCAGRAQPGSSGVAPTTGSSSPFAHVAPLPTRLDGSRFDPATLTGKPVVLWFWAPWCPICRSEGPSMANLASEFAGKVEFVGVAGQGTVLAMTQFVDQTGTGSLTQLADVTGSVWRDYGVSVQPSFAFIGSDGTAQVRVGSLDAQTLRARVAELAAGARTSSVTMTPGQYCSRAPDGRLVCGASGPPHSATTATTSATSP
jgi:thiol-disulfide isomerase/thioredoxin